LTSPVDISSETILGLLEELADLARRAVDANQRLYSWVSQ
jgi:hypothetical protein